MQFTAVLITLIASDLCAAQTLQLRAPEEPVFGIEFSIENIVISFVPPGGQAIGLASVKGNEAYQDLMYSYFELCHRAHLEQVPPKIWEKHDHDHDHSTSYEPYADTSELILDLVAYRHETHPNETDVEVLANAAETVKRVAADILAAQYNTTMPDRPLVALAAPNFMWTMTEPDFWEEESITDHGKPYDYGRDDWHHVFALKMSEAVLQAGFKLEPVQDTDAASASPRRLDHTFPIAPSGTAAFWDSNFPAGGNSSEDHPRPRHGTQDEGAPAVVFELTNATLSLWAQQKGQVWSPWYTRPQLGTHIRFGDHPGYMYSPDDWIWEDVVSMTRKLRNVLAQCRHESDEEEGEELLLRIYLTGDAWDADMVEAFTSHLRNHKLSHELEVVFRGGFAASDGAAWAATGMLDEVAAGL